MEMGSTSILYQETSETLKRFNPLFYKYKYLSL